MSASRGGGKLIGVCDSNCPEPEGEISQLLQVSHMSSRMAKKALPNAMVAAMLDTSSASTVLSAVNAGVNLLMWGITYVDNHTMINPRKVREIIEGLQEKRKDVVHILSLVGWDVSLSFMPGTCGEGRRTCSSQQRGQHFRKWNADFAKQVGLPNWQGFDGISWIEMLPWLAPIMPNTTEHLQAVLDLSTDLHNSFLVTILSPISSFNCASSAFDSRTQVKVRPPPFNNFHYSPNMYASVYAKNPAVFDTVIIQLYERTSYPTLQLYWGGHQSNIGKPGYPSHPSLEAMSSVVRRNIKCLTDGSWTVDFNGFFDLSNGTRLQLPGEKVAMALALDAVNYYEAYFDATAAAKGCSCGSRGFAVWRVGLDNDDSFFKDLSDMDCSKDCSSN